MIVAVYEAGDGDAVFEVYLARCGVELVERFSLVIPNINDYAVFHSNGGCNRLVCVHRMDAAIEQDNITAECPFSVSGKLSVLLAVKINCALAACHDASKAEKRIENEDLILTGSGLVCP